MAELTHASGLPDAIAAALNPALVQALQAGQVGVEGVHLSTAISGGWRVRLSQLIVRDITGPLGPVVVKLEQAVLNGVVLRLEPTEPGRFVRLADASAESLALNGLQLSTANPLQMLETPDAAQGIRWTLAPLAGLEGDLRAGITDAAWLFDADVHVPLRQGQVDFDKVTVSHIGPDSSMGVDPSGVYVAAPNGRTLLMRFGSRPPPGVRFGLGGAPLGALFGGDRGAINLQPFVEGLLSAGLDRLAATPLDVMAMLSRTRLDGRLQLGDGCLGLPQAQLSLSGSATGLNRVALQAEALGRQLVLRLPELSASQGHADAGDCTASVGPLTASLSATVTGVGTARPHGITVNVASLDLRDLRLQWPPAPRPNPLPLEPTG